MNRIQLLYGLVAGSTIFLGLPVAWMTRISERTRGFLNALSTGVLIFLLVEIAGKSIEGIEELLVSSTEGYATLTSALIFSGELIAGLAIGLLSMVFFENRFIRQGKDKLPSSSRAHHVAMMIAVGIGIHNLTEGLAIAQATAWGQESMALFLAVGFALHNATEGFGIAAPLSGQRASTRFLLLAGLIGGGPTLAGVIVGSYVQSQDFAMFSFGLAAGVILFVIGELLHLGRSLKGEAIAEIGLLTGFAIAFVTEMLVVWNGL
ncbi:MAG: ZIP family metal transporter [Elusimicrobia bacterium]|nr:ZIP family metal transporter [Elusimicrobiota bacterium]